MSASERERKAESFRTAVQNLPRRQMILGAYIAELYADGTVPREASVPELGRIATKMLMQDVKGLASFIIEQQVKQGISEVKRAFDFAVNALFHR